MPPWVASYIGRRFDPERFHCWALVATVLRDQFGVAVPDFAIHADDQATVERTIRDHRLTGMQVDDPRPGDVALLRVRGYESHVGLIVAPDTMLHVMARSDACLQRLDGLEWARRWVGTWRHLELA